MNPQKGKDAVQIAKEILKGAATNKNTEIIICPPVIFLPLLKKEIKSNKISLGAQNMFFEAEGAYTGEISAKMLGDIKIGNVILGHSERRKLGESDEMINKKLKVALKASISPIVCMGEKERDTNHFYLASFKEQIQNTFSGIAASSLAKITIAYEPIWAIGENAIRQASPEECTEMIIFIKRVLSDIYGKNYKDPRFIYGGSVHPENAKEFLTNGNVTGLLVGRDSLSPKKFLKIIEQTVN